MKDSRDSSTIRGLFAKIQHGLKKEKDQTQAKLRDHARFHSCVVDKAPLFQSQLRTAAPRTSFFDESGTPFSPNKLRDESSAEATGSISFSGPIHNSLGAPAAAGGPQVASCRDPRGHIPGAGATSGNTLTSGLNSHDTRKRFLAGSLVGRRRPLGLSNWKSEESQGSECDDSGLCFRPNLLRSPQDRATSREQQAPSESNARPLIWNGPSFAVRPSCPAKARECVNQDMEGNSSKLGKRKDREGSCGESLVESRQPVAMANVQSTLERPWTLGSYSYVPAHCTYNTWSADQVEDLVEFVDRWIPTDGKRRKMFHTLNDTDR